MTTRRTILTLMGGAALLTACREPAPSRTAERGSASRPDLPRLVLADTSDGLVGVRGGQVTSYGRWAAAAPDGRRVFAVTHEDGDVSVLHTVDPATDAQPDRVRLPGRWQPRVVSVDGGVVALSALPASGDAPVSLGDKPAPRARTALVIADRTGQQHRFDLPGNVEPDAFTRDGTGLFVLEWLPAEAPDHYRVRVLDFATGVIAPLSTRAKQPVPAGAEEEMRGDGRSAVLAPNGQILYTLYTHQPDHRHTRDIVAGRPGGVHAFVHVLHLTERWAFCLDLPHPFGQTPAETHTLAVTADGLRLVVATTGAGRVAVADTESLTLSSVAEMPTGKGRTAAAALSAKHVVVASGQRLLVMDAWTGAVAGTWTAGGEVSGLALSGDRSRLYVGLPGSVAWLDAATGTALGRLPVAGVTALRHAR